MRLPFIKMEGLGNDYVYVNTMSFPIENPSELSKIVSDRHFSIGSDGLVLIEASNIADFGMRIFNADGSEAQMCGNASRCVGKYLYEKGLTTKKVIKLETKSGIKTLNLNIDANNKVDSVRVGMGCYSQIQVPSYPMLGSKEFKGHGISMGNPHYVIFVEDIKSTDVSTEGSFIEKHSSFPEGTNVEFAKVISENHIRMRVWERGSGITMACGTGACATAVAATITGRVNGPTTIEMDGGCLVIECDAETKEVFMTGPATLVFEGVIEL